MYSTTVLTWNPVNTHAPHCLLRPLQSTQEALGPPLPFPLNPLTHLCPDSLLRFTTYCGLQCGV